MIDLEDHDQNDQPTVTRVDSHCPPGRDVVLYRVNDGGHRMPGAYPDARFDQTTVTRVESHCPPGRNVVLDRVNDGGHRMPGAYPDARFPRLVNGFLGPQNRDIDGAATIWAFFRQFP